MILAPLPVNMFFGPGLSFDPECLRTNPCKFLTIFSLLTLRTLTIVDSVLFLDYMEDISHLTFG